MKKFAKLTALVLALVLVFSLAACSESGKANPAPGSNSGSNTPAAPTIVGKWRTTVGFDAFLGEDAGEMGDLFKGQSLGLFLEFTQDGKVKYDLDEDSVRTMCDTIYGKMPEMIASQMGMSVSELEDLLAQQGMSMSDVLAQAGMASSADLADTILENVGDKTSLTANYTLEGDKVTITNEDSDEPSVLTITLTSDKLTVTKIENSSDMMEQMEKLLPWQFTRVN